MSSLRELYDCVEKYDKVISHSTHALLKALVEAVEPEDTELAKTKVEIERLRTRVENAISGAGVVTVSLRSELAEAKSNTVGHLESVRWWKQQLVEAKAEVEKLCARNKHLSGEINRLSEECHSLRPLADIGRLVRGMRRGTRLKRRFNDGLYEAQAEKATPNPRSRFMDNVKDTIGDDPTKALRAIQEVRDAEV